MAAMRYDRWDVAVQPHSAYSDCSPISFMGLNFAPDFSGAHSFPPASVYSPGVTSAEPLLSSYNPLTLPDCPSAQIPQHFVRDLNPNRVL